MAPLKLGLVGCGRIAQQVHLKILTRLPDARLVALAEPDAERRAEAARHAPGAALFADYGELLAMAEVDAVVVCLPNALHAKAALMALRHGKHVYLEKPLATSLAEARAVLAAWRSSGLVGMVGFNFRFNLLYRRLKELLESGRLGALAGARSVFSAAAGDLPPWKRRRDDGGGVLLDLASHHVDLIRFLFRQEVREIFAELRSIRHQDDSAAIQMRLQGGLVVQSFFSSCAVDEDRIEIYGQAGKMVADRYRSLNVKVMDASFKPGRLHWIKEGVGALVSNPAFPAKLRSPTAEPSYREALAHFALAAQGKETATPDFWDGFQSLQVIEAAEESSRTGRAVSLPELRAEDFFG